MTIEMNCVLSLRHALHHVLLIRQSSQFKNVKTETPLSMNESRKKSHEITNRAHVCRGALRMYIDNTMIMQETNNRIQSCAIGRKKS